MDEKKRLDAIQALERQINGLPIGYISKKNINGKARYYHQWTCLLYTSDAADE